MTKIATAAVLALTLAFGSVAASAAPTYGISVSSGQTNPFAAVDGR